MVCIGLLCTVLGAALAGHHHSPIKQPKTMIEVYPHRFIMKYPHQKGITSVFFKGDCLSPNEHLGVFEQQITQRTQDGYWTYINEQCELNINDAIDYTVYFEKGHLRYSEKKERFFVQGITLIQFIIKNIFIKLS